MKAFNEKDVELIDSLKGFLYIKGLREPVYDWDMNLIGFEELGKTYILKDKYQIYMDSFQ